MSASPATMMASSDHLAPSSPAKSGISRRRGADDELDENNSDYRPTKKRQAKTLSPATLYDSDGGEALEETEYGAQAVRTNNRLGP